VLRDIALRLASSLTPLYSSLVLEIRIHVPSHLTGASHLINKILKTSKSHWIYML
jgi:hypothetical protein